MMKLLFKFAINTYFWLWICIETIQKSVLGIHISEERNMFVAESFIRSLVDKYGKHTVYTQMVLVVGIHRLAILCI
jgi:hypothetical protein